MQSLLAFLAGSLMTGAAEPVEFNRDIRPILSNNCYVCHGPDNNLRKATAATTISRVFPCGWPAAA